MKNQTASDKTIRLALRVDTKSSLVLCGSNDWIITKIVKYIVKSSGGLSEAAFRKENAVKSITIAGKMVTYCEIRV